MGWNVRCVDDQSVPLAFDVFLVGLLLHKQPIELQLPCDFLLTFEDHEGHLPIKSRGQPRVSFD